jgi:hypothetical protein
VQRLLFRDGKARRLEGSAVESCLATQDNCGEPIAHRVLDLQVTDPFSILELYLQLLLQASRAESR